MSEKNNNIGPDWSQSARKGPWHFDADNKRVVLNGYAIISFPNPLSDYFSDRGEPVPLTDEQTCLIALIQGRTPAHMPRSFLDQLEEKLRGNAPNVIEQALEALRYTKPEEPVPVQNDFDTSSKPEPVKNIQDEEEVDSQTSVSEDFTTAGQLNQNTEHIEETLSNPWKYVPETGEISFGGQAINFKGHQKKYKLIKAMLLKAGKPVSPEEMQVILYGKVNQEKSATVNVLYLNTLDWLEEQIEGSSDHLIYRDYRGFRLFPFKGTPTLEKIDRSNVIELGPWAYDNHTDIIFYDGKPVQFQFFMYRCVRAAIENFPEGISIEELIEKVYPEKDIDSDNIEEFKSTFISNLGTIQRASMKGRTKFRASPLWNALPTGKMTLHISPSEWTDDLRDKMDVISYGDFHIVKKQGKIFIGNEGMKTLSINLWKAITYLSEKKGEFVSGSDLANFVYGSLQNGETIKSQQDKMGQVIRKGRRAINKFIDDLGNQLLRTHLTYGFVFCTSDAEYEKALAKEQSGRMYVNAGWPTKSGPSRPHPPRNG